MREDLKDSLALAINVRKQSYSKYSGYNVGAVLVTRSGKKYTGCNIENNGIQSICAERVAFCKALSEGERNFDHILVIGAPADADELERCLPCGYCRQFMSEFVKEDFKVYTIYGNKVEEYSMKELLPYAFKMK